MIPTPKKCLCFLGLILSNLLTKNSRSIYRPIMVLEHGTWKTFFPLLMFGSFVNWLLSNELLGNLFWNIKRESIFL